MNSSAPSYMPLVFMTSLGCSKNWVDSEIAIAAMLQAGFGYAADEKSADVWYINTCGFIASAREEGDEYMRKAVRWKKRAPQRRKIVIAGCIVSSKYFEEFKGKFPEVDLWIQPDEVQQVHLKMQAMFANSALESAPTKVGTQKYLYDHCTPRVQLTPEHFAYIKIADGCDNNCSYCAIPSIRGKSRSRTIESVIAEIQNLVQLGVKEIILIGQDITRFGMDREGGETLMQLLENIEKIEGDFWVRLLYLHPARYPNELTQLYKNAKHLVPYLEMPIQHISDNMLTSMNRKVTGARIKEIFTTLRQEAPQVALRTTFIVGYPGETDQDFAEVMDLIRTVEFDRVGAFIFQPEPHTPAAKLENPVDIQVAQQRYDALMSLQNEISLKRNQALIGQTVDVLIDDFDGEKMIGRTYRDAPEIDNIVFIRKAIKKLNVGDRVQAVVTDANAYELEATLLTRKGKL